MSPSGRALVPSELMNLCVSEEMLIGGCMFSRVYGPEPMGYSP